MVGTGAFLRPAKTALVEEQLVSSEVERQLQSNRGALRALYPGCIRRVATYFPNGGHHALAVSETNDEATTEELNSA